MCSNTVCTDLKEGIEYADDVEPCAQNENGVAWVQESANVNEAGQWWKWLKRATRTDGEYGNNIGAKDNKGTGTYGPT